GRGTPARSRGSGTGPPALRDRAHGGRGRADLPHRSARARARAAERRMSWKRTLDLAGSVALLLVTSPVLAIAALAIRATMGVPVLYRQKRTGLDARTFTLVKLRTMAPAPPGTADADRITSLGRWLRSTSIDELPQLWNVLRGDM